ncbi:protein of unknown function [Taphrina deformans PYCC 5710]|uniref:Uncharacterized protein n=1 Tax=Taphrina deformans (strain PYCC 5710 / ATCC 11124 / CBS 356.35 / IMI 108563 / JCM 9778 / NBRC 8474) TaxID=1097556 RepID=R4XP80_TAPDE|nr:protein of unknown function [Taphrina deformans PYCC 5710]|eukprot:CCG85055.1 protein of unknown function [Taphrina deformans PYCC 5710]
MSSQLAQSLDAMAEDWLSMATFVDLQLSAAREQDIKTQIIVLKDLFIYFSQTDHSEQLSAIAWDLVIPLSGFVRKKSTNSDALALFNLAIQHGNQKEVLLKLIEASKVLDYEEAEDSLDQFDLQLILLEAQEKVIKQIRTKRPSLFMAEYTKGILEALQKAESAANMPTTAQRYHAFITESVSKGALGHLEQNDNASDQEKQTMRALMRSFFTYVLAITAAQCNLRLSSQLFLEQHSHLNVPRPPNTNSEELNATPSFAGQTEFLDLVNSRFHDPSQLWECGAWAQHENEQSMEESDRLSDDEPECGNIPLSPSGSVILLAVMLRDNSTVDDQGTNLSLSSRFQKCQEALMELCARTDHALVTLDACLYLCGRTIGEQQGFPPRQGSEEDLLFVQTLSSISATVVYPEMRQIAHFLVKDFLACTTDRFRYEYYSGVLRDCPYEALRTATLALVKDEMATNSGFWSIEDNIHGLLVLALAWTHEDETEADEFRVQLWIQTINLIIFLLQKFPTSGQVQDMSSSWKESFANYLITVHGREETPRAELFRMYMRRVDELLATR